MLSMNKLSEFRNLPLEGRIVAFKSSLISQLVFQSLKALVPSHIIKALKIIQRSFLTNNSNLKTKHKTICKNYGQGGLQCCDAE